MGDLVRNIASDIIYRYDDLKKQHADIILSEKKSQLQMLEATLQRVKSVEQKKIEFQINILTKEIAELTVDGQVEEAEII